MLDTSNVSQQFPLGRKLSQVHPSNARPGHGSAAHFCKDISAVPFRLTDHLSYI